jgi:hypothetical protein
MPTRPQQRRARASPTSQFAYGRRQRLHLHVAKSVLDFHKQGGPHGIRICPTRLDPTAAVRRGLNRPGKPWVAVDAPLQRESTRVFGQGEQEAHSLRLAAT